MKQIGLFILFILLFKLDVRCEYPTFTGFWIGNEFDIQIEINRTRNGIEVVRLDNGNPYYYREVNINRFEDYEGNAYEFFPPNRLEFIPRDGRKILSFRKNSRDSYNWNYGIINQTLDHINGRWISNRQRGYMSVVSRSKTARIRFRGYWSTFEVINRRTLVNQYGQKIKLVDNNKILFYDDPNHRPLIFYRDNRRRYYCD